MEDSKFIVKNRHEIIPPRGRGYLIYRSTYTFKNSRARRKFILDNPSRAIGAGIAKADEVIKILGDSCWGHPYLGSYCWGVKFNLYKSYLMDKFTRWIECAFKVLRPHHNTPRRKRVTEEN